MSSRLTEKMQAAIDQGRTALIPYLPAGFPNRERFWTEIEQLDQGGADVIEIGVPFSDPVADGPTVEKAALECVADGISLTWILTELEKRRSLISAEIVLMGYMNPFMQYGLERFAQDAAKAGVAGVIVPDVPLEESGDFRAALEKNGLDFIALVGLNTSPQRMRLYADVSKGFVYFVSVLGTTGVRESLPEEMRAKLTQAKEIFPIPLALGFGIKSPEQLETLKGLMDGAVFGSALINHLRQGNDSASFMSRWR